MQIMAELESLQNSQISSGAVLTQRPNNGSGEATGAVPPPPAYPGHNVLGASGAGLLRTKISLGRKPTVIMPFVLMKPELPSASPINGNMNLLTYYGLDHAWNKFCGSSRKLKEELSAFLPHLPGNIDMPGTQDNSSLRSLIDKPPICGKEIMPLSTSALSGFKLQSGTIPENYRVFAGAIAPPGGSAGRTLEKREQKSERQQRKKHKRKHERSSHHEEERPVAGSSRDEKPFPSGASASASASAASEAGPERSAQSSGSNFGAGEEWRKTKTDESGFTEKKKKKKKDKKRKRSRSPDQASSSGAQSSNPSATNYATSSFVDF